VEKSLELGRKPDFIGYTAEGPTVAFRESGELWTVDSRELRVKTKASHDGLKLITWGEMPACSPALPTVFCPGSRGTLFGIDLRERSSSYSVNVVQLHTDAGMPAPRSQLEAVFYDFRYLAATPTGKHLLFVSHYRIHRLEVQEGGVRYGESSPKVVGIDQLDVSEDSKYVAALSTVDVQGDELVRVFRISDLTRPILTLSPGARPSAVGFDRTLRRIYLATAVGLVECSIDGGCLVPWVTGLPYGKISKVLVMPGGGRMVLVHPTAMMWVERHE